MNLNYLKPGDKIALVCPGNICLETIHPQLTQAYLYKLDEYQSIYDKETIQSLSPEKRAHILLKYLFDPNIKLIAQLRGGEGTADILPYLHNHYDKIKLLSPKYLLGFSDYTALLIYFAQYYRWPVIHGPSLLQFALKTSDEQNQQFTFNLLKGNTNPWALNNLIALNAAALENKIIEAELNGGNLSVIQISIKDIWEINLDNKIVFFEDCGEKAHKIIRTLKYFSRIGLFNKVKAVILGDFTSYSIGSQKEEQEKNAQAILKCLTSFATHHDFPVLYTTQFGHGKLNFPLMYNKIYQLRLGQQAQLLMK